MILFSFTQCLYDPVQGDLNICVIRFSVISMFVWSCSGWTQYLCDPVKRVISIPLRYNSVCLQYLCDPLQGDLNICEMQCCVSSILACWTAVWSAVFLQPVCNLPHLLCNNICVIHYCQWCLMFSANLMSKLSVWFTRYIAIHNTHTFRKRQSLELNAVPVVSPSTNIMLGLTCLI